MQRNMLGDARRARLQSPSPYTDQLEMPGELVSDPPLLTQTS